MSNSFGYRKDGRTDQEFARSLKVGTWAEREIMEILRKQEQEYGRRFEFQDNGVDNSGELIREDSGRSKQDYQEPDFSNVVWERYDLDHAKLEVKTHKAWPSDKGHIKVGSLKGCVEHGAGILMADPNGFLLFRPEGFARVLREAEYIAEWSGGGKKPAYRYTAEKVKGWVKSGDVVREEWDSTRKPLVEDVFRRVEAEKQQSRGGLKRSREHQNGPGPVSRPHGRIDFSHPSKKPSDGQ